jgi:membrane protein DedA with SNARE-associated domain
MSADIAVPASERAPVEGIAGWAVEIMQELGGPGAGLVVALENLFPPLPSEVILPLAGFTASRGDLSLAAALAWTTAGSVVGALILYWLSAAFGRVRVRRLARRMPLIELTDLDRAEAWFARHGGKAVFFGRMIPLVRSLISVPAGVERMPPLRFVALTALGSALWNSGFVLAGFWLGERWHEIDPYADASQKVVLAGAILAAATFAIVRLRGGSRRAAG